MALEFRLLGPFEVLRSGERVGGLGPRQRCLLACLLAHANQVVSAERLIEELWGDEPPPTATTALQVHVSRLRKALEETDGGGAELVVTRRPGYLIRVDAAQVDTLRFEQLASRGRTRLAAGDVAAAAGDLGDALGLWRGPALSELADHGFAQAWTARLELLRLAALEDRVDADLALGRHRDVVDELAALVEAEPLRERLWGQLMLALYRCGRQAEALRAFGQLRRTLADELGIDPSPELRRLEGRLLDQAADLDWVPQAAATDATAGAPDRILVGREEELATLVGRFERAAAGEGSLVLVRGEPGVGKTRVVEELAAVARARGGRVLWGQSFEDVGGGPFGPWAAALRRWAAGVAPETLDELLGRERSLLAQVLPAGTTAGAADPAPSADPDAARLRLFEAATSFLRRLGRDRTTVVVLDDLQWADGVSLLLLQHVTRELPGSRLLVVATYRDAEVARDHPLTPVLGDLARQRATERLALTGLPPAAVGRMIELETGVPPGPLAEAVHRRTDGNPFLVEEVVRLLKAEDRLFASAPMESLGIPDGVREVVDRRCARLSTAAQRLLGVAAAAGREFDAAVVEGVWDGPEPALDLLEEVEAAGLAVADRQAVGRYRFSHDIVREAVYAGLSPLRGARLHARIGLHLLSSVEAFRTATDPAVIAHHLLLGIHGGVAPAVAAEHAARAAAAATASLAYEEAVDWYERGVAALDGSGDGAERPRVGLLLALGEARWRAGDVPGARTTLLDAAERARGLGPADDGLLARAVLAFGGGALRSWHATRGTFGDRPLCLLEEALVRIGEGDTALRAQLLGLLAEELYYQQPAAARRDALTRQAVDMARRLGDQQALASALISRCLALWGPDHLDERLGAATEIVRLGDALDDRQLRFFGNQYVFIAQFEAGDVAAADATLGLVETLAEELRQPLARWEARRFRAMRALCAGRLEDAERLALEALEIGQGAQEPDAMAVFGVQLALVRFEQRRLAEIEPVLEAFAVEFVESPAWRAAVALVKADLGRTDDARAELEALTGEELGRIRRDFSWLAAMAMLAQLCAFFDDRDRAAAVTDLLLPFAGRNVLTGDRQSWGSSCRYLGMLAFTEGRLDEAERWQVRAIEENTRWGAAPWSAYTQCELAATLLATGEPAARRRAADLARDAAATAGRLGMARLLAAAVETGRRAGGEGDGRGLATMRPWSAGVMGEPALAVE